MAIARILIGLCLLVFGRKLFWLVVAAIGFFAAMALASEWLHGPPQTVVILISIGIGILGAFLALFLQKVAVVVAGFVAGGYFAFTLVNRFAPEATGFPWIPVIVGAILGAVLLAMIFKWALIFLSSIMGAYLIVQSVDVEYGLSLALFVVLAIGGIVAQAGALRKKQRKKGEEKEKG